MANLENEEASQEDAELDELLEQQRAATARYEAQRLAAEEQISKDLYSVDLAARIMEIRRSASTDDMIDTPTTPSVMRRHMFAAAYAVEFNTERAAAAVGIALDTAKQWLRRPEVRAFIEAESAKRLARFDFSTEWVLTNMAKVLRMALGDDPQYVVATADGVAESYLIRKSDLGVAKGVLEMFGKHNSMFVDRVEVTANLPIIELNMTGEKPPIEGQLVEDDDESHTADGLSLGPTGIDFID